MSGGATKAHKKVCDLHKLPTKMVAAVTAAA